MLKLFIKNLKIAILLLYFFFSKELSFAYPTGYITPTCSGACCNDYMTAVLTTGGTSNFSYTASTNTSNYHDYHTLYNVSAIQGNTITIKISRESTYTVSGNIWIDWNQNGVFESSEQILSTYTAIPSTGSYVSITVTVPSTAPLGATCLRVGCVHPTATLTSTFASWYGEYIDFQFTVQPSTTVLISNTSPTVANVPQGTINALLQTYNFNVSGGPATLSGLTIVTGGSYIASDIYNLKCWYSNSSIFSTSTATLLSTLITPGASGTFIFTPFIATTIPIGNGYIYITADISNAATIGNDIQINTIPLTDFSLGSVSVTGSVATSNLQTFIAGTNCTGVPNAGAVSPSPINLCSIGSATLFDSGLSTGPGITYQWYSNSTNSLPGIAIAGATTTTYIPTVSATTYYWCSTSCSLSSSSNISAVGIISINSVPIVSTPIGATNVALGAAILLIDTSYGAISYYTSSSTTIATADTFGDITGISVGTSNIYYNIVTSAGCVGTSVAYPVNVINSPYCVTTSHSTGDAIGFSTTGGITNIPYASYTSGYTNLITSTGITVTPGTTINYTIYNNSTTSFASGSTCYVWSDWNIDYTFADSTLEFILSGTSLGLGAFYSGSFSIPTTAKGGFSVMRIGQYETASTNPCAPGGSGYGSVVDFYVRVLPTITIGGTPTACLGGTATQTITSLLGTASSYHIVWNSTALAAGFSNIPNTTLTSDTAFTYSIPSSLVGFSSPTTYSGTLYVNAGAYESQGTPISITVNSSGSVSPITGSSAVCTGLSILLSDITSGGSWTSTTPTVATVNSSGVVAGIAAGTTIISYGYSGSCGSYYATTTITVNPLPISGTITGIDSVCIGSTISLIDTTSGGIWSAGNSNATVVAGDVMGVTAGTDSIKYAVTNSCGTSFAYLIVTINPLPNAGTISGIDSVCLFASTSLLETVAGGTWSAINSNASVSGGVVSGAIVGIDSIKYSLTNSCGTATTSVIITINPLPNAGTITGIDSVCIGSTVTVSNTITTGVWSIYNSNAILVGNSVTGIMSGIDTVFYTVTNSCGINIAKLPIKINPIPISGTISGSGNLCLGSITTLIDSATGGTWSLTNIHASIIPTGYGAAVTGISIGLDTAIYTVNTVCGTSSVSKIITINSAPTTNGIIGDSLFCQSTYSTFTDTSSGGTWSCSNSHATVLSGVVLGLSGGTDTLIYTYINTCGTATDFKTITINPLANPGVLTGTNSVCLGSSITIGDTILGGLWSVSNSNANVVGGIVIGLSVGTDTVKYSKTNGCGTQYVFAIITINPLPNAGVISGFDSVCQLANITLTDLATGGSWSSVNLNASVFGGIVTGTSAGTDSIKYTVVNSCGTAIAGKVVTVNPSPFAGTITGNDSVCQTANITLTDLAPGGSWIVQNGNASVLAGIVSGILTGLDTVIYSVSNICGTDITSKAISIKPLPFAGTITGIDSVCAGSSITLSDSISGGIWSASNTKASVSGGIITGIVAGTDTIKYTITNSCGNAIATKVVTINALPNIGTILGTSNICTGAITTVTNFTIGGTWGVSNSNVNTLPFGSSLIATGNTIGIDTISYSITNICGTNASRFIITVNPAPIAGIISGLDTVCQLATTSLSSSVGGGIWSEVNGNTSISSSGIVTGYTAGIDTVKYAVSNSCGTAYAKTVIKVNPLPSTHAILGNTIICLSIPTTLTDSTIGGIWSASNNNVNTIILGNHIAISGMYVGVDTITYAISNNCGTSSVSKVVTVNPFPTSGTIVGLSNVCVGASISLTDSILGGTWTSNNTKAIVTGGLVSGVHSGKDTLKYIVVNSCGSSISTKIITINPNPIAGSIVGVNSICPGHSMTLSDTTAVPAGSGTWSSTNAIAIISGSGVINGVTVGVDTIKFTVSNLCGTTSAVKVVTIDAFPVSGNIIDTFTNLCVSGNITLTDSIAGGTWYSGSLATITPIAIGGILTGISAGIDTVKYIVSNSCGSSTATKAITIYPLPPTGTISGLAMVCVGSTISLTESVSGGVWTSKNTNANASITGNITGVTAGIDSIQYTVSNSCGSRSIAKAITINPLPFAGIISGDTTLCQFSTTSLITNGNAGGIWSVTNTNCIISDSGIVYGTHSGKDTIQYSYTNICGTKDTSFIIRILPIPNAGVITGITNVVCVGATIHFSDSTAIGNSTWNATTGHSSVIGGVVTGITAGEDTVTYNVSNICGSSFTNTAITINPLPFAGIITGIDSICLGNTLSFNDTIAGGNWNLSNVNAVIVSITPAAIFASSVGIDTLQYIYTNMCGADTTNKAVSILGLPYPGTINGNNALCVGQNTQLTDSIFGGTWSSSNNAHLTIVNGLVTALQSGIDTIIYTITNYCGSSSTQYPINLENVIAHHAITGLFYVCPGRASDTLLCSPSGGNWSITNNNVSINNGVVVGLHPGFDTIIYTVTNVCGTVNDSFTIRIPTIIACDSINDVSTIPNLNKQDIKVYPNPSTGTFTVEINNPIAIVNASLIDIYGKVIETKNNFNNEKITFETAKLPSGNYLVLVEADGQIYKEKLVIVAN